jgi:hypothetical protein
MAEHGEHTEIDPLNSSHTRPPAKPPGSSSEVPHLAVRTGSRLLDLIAGTARVGVSASVVAAGDITSRSVKIARTVLPTGMAAGLLETIERQVKDREHEARRNEQQGLVDVASAAESVLNRVVVEVVDMLDMEQLIDHVPIDRVVARVDLPAVIDAIDLSGVVREATTGLGGETLDGVRSGLMAIDVWSARVVDKILRRRRSRDLGVEGTRIEAADMGALEVQP